MATIESTKKLLNITYGQVCYAPQKLPKHKPNQADELEGFECHSGKKQEFIEILYSDLLTGS